MDHEALTQNILKWLEGIFQDFKLIMYSDLGWICGRLTPHWLSNIRMLFHSTESYNPRTGGVLFFLFKLG